jgi:hypothetical protein
MILEASTVALALAAGAEYFRSRRGPLVLLAVGVLHARAILLCLGWELALAPTRWRRAYPLAVMEVKEWK